MLCETCWLMLHGQDRRQWKGTYDLYFSHQSSLKKFRESADMDCGICRVLWDELKQDGSLDHAHDDGEGPANTIPISTASLRVIPAMRDSNDNEVYRLDFNLKHGSTRKRRTFVLNHIEGASAPFRTPISDRTDSGEVFMLALKWISNCKCVDREPRWYPTRLIDLSALKSEEYANAFRATYAGNPGSSLEDFRVRLIGKNDRDADLKLHNRHYVTLSHRWGAPGEKDSQSEMLQLRQHTLHAFKEGLRLGELPRTFRDVLKFAAQLHNVWYIWIDSLCIIQDSTADWLEESALMHKVYSEAYLNISATAAENNEAGIYSDRTPKRLWEEEVNLNIEGLPGSNVEKLKSRSYERSTQQSIGPLKRTSWTWPISFHWSPFSLFKKQSSTQRNGSTPTDSRLVAQIDLGGKELTMSLTEHDYIRRCTLMDASMWETLVNQASVNRRAWVLQERLLAPRVLHFCQGQIAWECSEFDAAEGLPPGSPNFQVHRDDVFVKTQTKGLDPQKHGKNLRNSRLQGAKEPDPHLLRKDAETIYAFEIWNRIVETYSRTDLTMEKDKLIALSGIANRMSKSIKCDYVAGLWGKYLASQLLWRVEPVFHLSTRSFTYPSKRPRKYRAPSFTWASVNAQMGNGITCAEVTDKDILIKIESTQVEMNDANRFGLVKEGHIILWGKLRNIELRKSKNGRYCWFLRNRNIDDPSLDLHKLHEEKHSNVYLDCPSDDDIFDHPSSDRLRDDIYCLPVSKGERTEIDEAKYLFCLLLQLVPESDERYRGAGTFRRIGMTKLSPWADKLALQYILEPSQADVELPYQGEGGYRDKVGEHRICLI